MIILLIGEIIIICNNCNKFIRVHGLVLIALFSLSDNFYIFKTVLELPVCFWTDLVNDILWRLRSPNGSPNESMAPPLPPQFTDTDGIYHLTPSFGSMLLLYHTKHQHYTTESQVYLILSDCLYDTFFVCVYCP